MVDITKVRAIDILPHTEDPCGTTAMKAMTRCRRSWWALPQTERRRMAAWDNMNFFA